MKRIQIDATLNVNGRDRISIMFQVKQNIKKSIKQILMELQYLILAKNKRMHPPASYQILLQNDMLCIDNVTSE